MPTHNLRHHEFGKKAERFASAKSICILAVALLAGCGGGGGGSPLAVDTHTVFGKVTYDFVPAVGTITKTSTTAALDYANTARRPVRMALVEAVSSSKGEVVATAFTDAAGEYSMQLPTDKTVYIRVVSQIQPLPGNNPDGWVTSVRDNTAPEYKVATHQAALYAVRGDEFETTVGPWERDLNAGSGWDSTATSYIDPRAAAPFAILDQIEAASQKMIAAAPTVHAPPLDVFWSVDNRPAKGEKSLGYIETAHFQAGEGVYLSGAENVDTDEYDASVVIHEYGHFIENALSRSDSLGDQHSSTDAIDMRVGFGEAWGTSLASMVRNDPMYVDTAGPKQAEPFVVEDLTSVPVKAPKGFAGEASLGNFLYKLSMSSSVGFTPIYTTMLNEQKNTPAMTSLFSFATGLRSRLDAAGKARLDQLLADMDAPTGDAMDAWGTNQTISPPDSPLARAVLPIYSKFVNGVATACTTNNFGLSNKLGSRAHLRIQIPAAGRYQFDVDAIAPDVSSKFYDLTIRRMGKEVAPTKDAGDQTFNFETPGDYTADLIHESSIEGTRTSALHCATISLQKL